MQWISVPGLEYLSPEWIVGTLGAVGVLVVLFIETGLLVGLVLPGDSMLFLAGVAASGTANATVGVQLPLNLLLIGAPIATFTGSQVGYLIGRKLGPKIFSRPDGKYFNQKRVEQTEKWLLKYGVGKALFFSRFIPIVRTLINPMCGVARIDPKKFAVANALSATIWGAGFIYVGFVVGEQLEGSVDRYLVPVLLLIMVVSMMPIFTEMARKKKQND